MAQAFRPTVRRWTRAAAVGMVGPEDVKTLQKRVTDYHARLHSMVISAPLTPAPSSRPFTIIDWQSLTERCDAFAAEGASGWNPLDYFYAGSAYSRGRDLIIELDAWRDELVRLGVNAVPAPLPVPGSDIGLAGGIGFALAAILGILILKEIR